MNRRLHYIWPGAVALLFTLIMLQWSYDRFRLHSAPFLDDVNWIDEGIAMLNAVRDGGILGLPHYFAQTRSLAPYSMVAAAGFGIFGIADWVPYLLNGWLIVSLLLFLEIARRRYALPLRAWFLAAAVALAFPICGYSIVSFLGDNATGLFIAIGVVAFIEGWPAGESRAERWAGPLAWIFASYGKATLFPETIFLFFVSAILGMAIGIRNPGLKVVPHKLVRGWAWSMAMVLGAVLPYYFVVGRNLYDYLYLQNAGALHHVWAFKGSLWSSLTYYLTGFSGETMLGPALFMAVGLIAFRAAFLPRDDAAARWRFGALMLLTAFAYALPTWLTNKTLTVASPFQFLVVLVAVMSLYSLLARRHSGWLEIAVIAAVLLTFEFPQPLDRRATPAVVARNDIMHGLLAALQAQDLKPGEAVFLTSTGYVSANTLYYEFSKLGLPMPHFYELSLSEDASQFAPLIDQAAFVIATESGNDDVFYTAPAAFIQDKTLAMVQHNAAFIEAARFSTWRGKHYYLFGRRDRVKKVFPPSEPDIPPPSPVLAWGFSEPMPDHWRWTRRQFAIDFPAPRGLYAELKLHLFIPQPNIDKLGPIAVEAEIPREGRHSLTFSQPGFHDFTYRYVIQQHLVSTVLVRFRVNKVLPPIPGSSDDFGVLFRSAELNPIAALSDQISVGQTPWSARDPPVALLRPTGILLGLRLPLCGADLQVCRRPPGRRRAVNHIPVSE